MFDANSQARERAVLVFLRSVDAELLANLSRDFSIADLGLSSSAEPAAKPSHVLRGADGDVLGHLVWQVDLPGRYLVEETLLPLSLAFLLLAGLALAALRTPSGCSLRFTSG